MYKFTTKHNNIRTSSEFLNDAVMVFREDLPGAAEALVEVFEPLTSKYFRLLIGGHWDVDDRDVAAFLRMISRRDPGLAAENISRSINRLCEPADIRQELILVLLETARRYVNVSSNYRYVLREHMKQLLGNSLIYDRLVDEPELEDIYQFIEVGAIDSSWVNGLTAGDGFENLTQVQRAILKCIYSDGLAVTVAAKKLKISTRQLRRIRNSAETTLAEALHIQREENDVPKDGPHIKREARRR